MAEQKERKKYAIVLFPSSTSLTICPGDAVHDRVTIEGETREFVSLDGAVTFKVGAR